jgi:CheY-like chemotaxis protein
MKCPRCQSAIASAPDASGALVCPSCGARLRSKASAGPARARAASEASAKAPEAERGRKSSAAAVLENPNATLPPGTPLRPIPKPGSTRLSTVDPDPAPAAIPSAPAVSLDALLEEIRALRRTQDEILALLRARPERGESGSRSDDPFGFGQETPTSVTAAASASASAAAAVRSRRRKSVLLLDDDPATRQAAVTALERAEVPVRAYDDGNLGLQALAEERCDVLVLELGMGGAMGGKDVVNLIKATMEWVDIPIVLYTRLPVQGQKEARTIHGADELVPKAQGSEDALVARVIALFRRP